MRNRGNKFWSRLASRARPPGHQGLEHTKNASRGRPTRTCRWFLTAWPGPPGRAQARPGGLKPARAGSSLALRSSSSQVPRAPRPSPRGRHPAVFPDRRGAQPAAIADEARFLDWFFRLFWFFFFSSAVFIGLCASVLFGGGSNGEISSAAGFEQRISHPSEPQRRILDFCLSISELLEL